MHNRMLNIALHIALSSRRLAATTVALILLCGLSNAQLYINGVPAVSDNGSNILIYSVPREAYGSDFTALVQADTTCQWHNITVNGQSLANNPITFADLRGEKAYLVRAIENNKPIVKRLMFTSLPIMTLEGDIGYDFTNALVTLITPDGKIDQGMTALVKWRGGYTNMEGRHKRNYSIKFIDANGEKQNRKLLGMRRDNHWKLDAGQVDLSRVRNRIATDLWLDMSRPPYYIDQAPDALTAARGEMVEVVVNGNYMGIYSLMESIDRKQLQVRKYDEDTHTFHGMIWNTTSWSRVGEFKVAPEYDNDSPNYDVFEIEYPEFEDVHPTLHDDLYNAIKFVVESDVEDFNAQGHYYFDMPVFIDYGIFIQFLISIDNGVNNIYWAIFDRDEDKRLTLAAWDLDWSLGTNRDSPNFRGGKAEPDYDYRFSSRHFRYLNDPQCIYHNDMIERYWQLRKTWLNEKNLSDRINALVNRLVESGSVYREQLRWSGDSDIKGLPLDIVGEKEYIIDWIKKRLAHLDRTMMRHPCDVNGDGAVTSYDITALQQYLLHGIQDDDNLDVNGDGVITSTDLGMLYDFILGNNR